METISTKIKRSGKGFGEHGHQLFQETKQAGQSFMSFVQGEAKDWGEYLRDRYQDLGTRGREMLHRGAPGDTIWTQLDGIIGKVTHRETGETPMEASSPAESSEIIETADEVEMIDETSEFEEVEEDDESSEE